MSIYRNIYSGLGAGAIAAIFAVLISLPLESPDDIIFNAASVGFASLIVGAMSGLLWHWADDGARANRRHAIGSLALVRLHWFSLFWA
jgi:hypothetical protein